MNGAFHNAKNKKFKRIYLCLQTLETPCKKAVLTEYFSLCKTVYMIQSTVNYILHQAGGQGKFEKLTTLSQDHKGFRALFMKAKR